MDIVYQDGNRSVVVVMKAIDWVGTDLRWQWYVLLSADQFGSMVQGQTDDAKHMTSEYSALKRC